MNKIIFFLFLFAGSFHNSIGQASDEKIFYIIDSIPVWNDPAEDDEIKQSDIAELVVIKNRDSLKLLGYEKFDGVIYLFTKEYRNRSKELKQIPSTKQMERKDGVWLLNGSSYSGQFINYYNSGKKQEEGTLVNGKINGVRIIYYQNGKAIVERNYKDGLENGLEKEYYEDGSLKQKGEFVNGKEEGIWDMYFPNGQLKQRSTFLNGKIDGETTVYYSTGKILAVEFTKNGETTPDKHLEKIIRFMKKSRESRKEGDNKSAIRYCSKAIELDSTYAEAYFSRGTMKLNDFEFDDAIIDLNMALKYEPYMGAALSNRAVAKIRKYQYGNSRVLSQNDDVTILATKDKVTIPPSEQKSICDDLRKAIFLGYKSKLVTDIISDYCKE